MGRLLRRKHSSDSIWLTALIAYRSNASSCIISCRRRLLPEGQASAQRLRSAGVESFFLVSEVTCKLLGMILCHLQGFGSSMVSPTMSALARPVVEEQARFGKPGSLSTSIGTHCHWMKSSRRHRNIATSVMLCATYFDKVTHGVQCSLLKSTNNYITQHTNQRLNVLRLASDS